MAGFAEDFDVKAFVDKVRDMGGKYIVWSATWSDYLFPAPIKAIAEVLPDRVSKRDLIGDLIKECHKYNIRVMLYYHLGHDSKEVLLAKGWKAVRNPPRQTHKRPGISAGLDFGAFWFTEGGGEQDCRITTWPKRPPRVRNPDCVCFPGFYRPRLGRRALVYGIRWE